MYISHNLLAKQLQYITLIHNTVSWTKSSLQKLERKRMKRFLNTQ